MMIKSLTEIECVARYLERIGAEARSLRKAVVKIPFGKYWKEDDVIKFAKSGLITCKKEVNKPTDAEQKLIAEAFKEIKWPTLKPISKIVNPPKMISMASDENLFIFRDEQSHIVMVQVRVEDGQGGKNYVPWTYWSDDEWRCAEPEDALPLFNAERLPEAATVFIHEGAKAARHVQWMVDGATPQARAALASHPWGEELKHAVHVGWIGGAMAHRRTNWKRLNELGVKTSYIVADNDSEGFAAVQHVSRMLRMTTHHVQFDDKFPTSFDLADKFPENLFVITKGGERIYSGPAFSDCVHPATFATDAIPQPKGRPLIVLRSHFRDQWAWLQDINQFVNINEPNKLRDRETFNQIVRPFSDTVNTAAYLLKEYRGTRSTLCYRPDLPDKVMIENRGEAAINLYRPPTIKPVQGDPKPFLDFLEYMFVNEKERYEMTRWLATMIACPGTRMRYGVLLVSEAQGIGKSTLGMKILKPLIGHSNVSLPNEGDITHPDFNAWIAGKRLAIVNEIYHGHSWKAYNKLKTVMADDEISINEKYKPPYTVENWIQVFACSNSMRCLRIERDDRRWLFPEMTEDPWGKDRFDALFKWLRLGGLNIILHWAQTFPDHVSSVERAPMTQRKHESIIESQSEAEREVGDLAAMMEETEESVALTMREIRSWLQQQCKERIYENDYEIRRAMRQRGVSQYGARMKIDGRSQYVIINSKLGQALEKIEVEEEKRKLIRESVKPPHEILKVDV